MECMGGAVKLLLNFVRAIKFQKLPKVPLY